MDDDAVRPDSSPRLPRKTAHPLSAGMTAAISEIFAFMAVRFRRTTDKGTAFDPKHQWPTATNYGMRCGKIRLTEAPQPKKCQTQRVWKLHDQKIAKHKRVWRLHDQKVAKRSASGSSAAKKLSDASAFGGSTAKKLPNAARLEAPRPKSCQTQRIWKLHDQKVAKRNRVWKLRRQKVAKRSASGNSAGKKPPSADEDPCPRMRSPAAR